MTKNQLIRINTAGGIVDYSADHVHIRNGEYIIMDGPTEIHRIPITDVIAEGESSGIETVFSRSM